MSLFIEQSKLFFLSLSGNPINIALIGAALIIILLMIWNMRLERKIGKILMGKNAISLEESLTSVTKDLKTLKQFTKDMEEYLITVEKRLKKSIQSVETIRYNPFKGTGSGGNQSFSATFSSEEGNGLILTSMYARDRISMFAKPIKAFASEFELSEEETESVTRAKESLIK